MKKLVVLGLLLSGFLFCPNVFADDVQTGSTVYNLGEVLVLEKSEQAQNVTTVTNVSEETIKQQGARNVAEALNQIPGVNVVVGNKGQASVNLRGFTQDDVKVLIDGVPAHESYFGSLDLMQIPVDAVAKIEVTKGVSSALYGANTMGGVINIITKKGGDEPFTQLTTSAGNNNTHNVILNHGGSAGAVNYWMTYGYRESDGFELSDDFDPNNVWTGLGSEHNEDGGTRDLSDYTKRSFNGKIGIEPDAGTEIYLTFDYHNNEKGCPTESSRYWEFTKWDQWHLNLAGQHQVNDLLTVKGRAYYVDHNDTLEDVSWDANHTTGRKWFEESSYDDFTAGGEAQGYLDFGPASLVKIGASYMKDNHKQQDLLDDSTFSVIMGWEQAGFLPEEEYEADTWSFAIEDEIKPLDKLAIVLGCSYDMYEPVKAYDQDVPDKSDSFNPQAGINYDMTEDLAFHASVGKKTRFPQLKELYSDVSGGNPNLDPQKAIVYEVGASHRLNDNINTRIAYFYNDIEDRIDTVTLPSGDPIYVNIGESTTQGVELAMDMALWENLMLGANYTYQDAYDKADDTSDEVRAEKTPRHKVNVDAGYRFDVGFSAFVQASYTRDQVTTYRDPVTFMDVERDLDNYLLLNARVSQNFVNVWKKFSAELFAEVKNITDENYEEGEGPTPGRNYLFGITMAY
ncbi:MAG: TonB-dependent receptor [Desulfobacterales bacterium]|nr:TonB-dependent receptor [Desulfobacterales bacterium]